MNCKKCGIEIDGSFGSGKYCSRSCANSRIRTDEIKRKIGLCVKTSEKFKNYCIKYNKKERKIKNKICPICNTIFSTFNNNQKLCSVKCSCKNRSILGAIAANKKYSKEDWSKIHKKAYADGRNRVAGGTTKWIEIKCSNGTIKVQGTYEVRMVKLLDIWKTNGKIKDWKYPGDRFQYIGEDNKKHTYIIDFKVIENDNNFYYIETKGYERNNDKYKWNSVRKTGNKLNVIFNEDLIKLEQNYGGVAQW